MKNRLIPLLLCVAALTGCSGNSQSEAELPPMDSLIQEEQPQAAPSYTGLIYYVTDHGTPDPAQRFFFAEDLEDFIKDLFDGIENIILSFYCINVVYLIKISICCRVCIS